MPILLESSMVQPGKFITFEGIDGAGKSTHLAWLTKFLQNRGLTVVVTREPGGTVLGERLRELLLDQRQTMHAETETLLMFAARREHLDKVILPALARGDWVVSDRYMDASFAYQGAGRGVPLWKLALLEEWVQGIFSPDLTLYFDLPAEIGKARVQSIKTADRFEAESDQFFEHVRQGYLQRAQQFQQRISVIDASLPIEQVKQNLMELIEAFYRQHGGQ
ncbi:MAG TPA: dTMP kinase [Nitrosomonas mobilis]|nr:dTMP kinase [Nitrosomonas mobilis]